MTGTTPYEAWSGVKPNVSALRIFGCSAYAHVPKLERHKLEPKARKCVMLGYGTTQKGYHLYDLACMKLIHYRDVVFDEDSLPGIQKDSSSKCVELKDDDGVDVEQTNAQSSLNRETDSAAETEYTAEE